MPARYHNIGVDNNPSGLDDATAIRLAGGHDSIADGNLTAETPLANWVELVI